MRRTGLLTRFADLLEYPGPGLREQVESCETELRAEDGEVAGRGSGGAKAADELAHFRAELDRAGLASIEERYTSAFDLDPGCALYAGHHLYGENANRSLFMLRLASDYREAGLALGEHDLPDYIPVMLRYLDAAPRTADRRDLISDAIIPAVRQVLRALEQHGHVYAHVLRALLALLLADRAATPSPAREGTLA